VRDRRLSVALAQSAPIPLDVEFECGAGDVLAVFGPSGSGKTTILRAIAGLYRPQTARVRCGGETWTDTAQHVFLPPHKRAVGFVFQDYALFPHLTALGNVETALGHVESAQRRGRAESLLSLVRLTERGSSRPQHLSGGERQRVALARALARDPGVLLLDEPFAAIDRVVRRQLQDEVDQLRRSLDIPLVLVTHDFEDVVRLASHVLVLERGRAVAAGAVSELMSRPDVPFLREAIGRGSVVDTVVTGVHGSRGLIELAFGPATLLAPLREVTTGTRVRLRVPAREVILATQPPEGLSLHNVLTGTVSAVHLEGPLDPAVVQLAVGEQLLLAEVTRDAIERLRIVIGTRLYALIKSVSIEVTGQ